MQLELLGVDPGHGPLGRDVIRARVAGRLWIGVLHPVVNGFPRALDTEPPRFREYIRK